MNDMDNYKNNNNNPNNNYENNANNEKIPVACLAITIQDLLHIQLDYKGMSNGNENRIVTNS